MNLVDQAEIDLAITLEDAENGFGVPVVLIDPFGTVYSLSGQTTDIGFFIDPNTGVGMAGRTAEIVFRLSTLFALQEKEELPSKNWKFQTIDVNGKTWNFSLDLPLVDRKIGIMKMTVGLLDVS
jgi:hypothetical protein